MAIRFTKYIDITSGVGAGITVKERELIARLFSTNPLIPTDSFIEFDTAAEVGSYFGTSSAEYARAVYYFSYISKTITQPQKISYARWVNADTAPHIYGARLVKTLTQLKTITAGSFGLTLGGVTNQISALDFSGASSLADIATLIEAGINAETGTQWTAATVTYDATRGSFDFVGGSAVAANVIVSAGTIGTNIASQIGWLPQNVNGVGGAIWSDGALTESITDTLTLSAATSDNFGSFLFMPSLTIDQIVEAATWNNLQNVKFQYQVPVADKTDAANYAAALALIGGVGITVIGALSGQLYHEMIPMAIEAATRYDQNNATVNYMYKDFPASVPTVTTDDDSDYYDSLRINYYGQTQTAGQPLSFYQRGFLQGQDTDPLDMNVYANEQWLKAAIGDAIISLQLNLPQIPANAAGAAQILSAVQNVINQALANGVISVQGVLSDTQKAFITTVTGDPTAWYQVQNSGYVVSCVIVAVVNNDVTEYKAQYTLIYKKNDVVRIVQGTDELI